MNERRPGSGLKSPNNLKKIGRAGTAVIALAAAGVVGYSLNNGSGNELTPQSGHTNAQPKPKKHVKQPTPQQLQAEADWRTVSGVVNEVNYASPGTSCSNPAQPTYKLNFSFEQAIQGLKRVTSPDIEQVGQSVSQYVTAEQSMWLLNNYDGNGSANTGVIISNEDGNTSYVTNTATPASVEIALANVSSAISIPNIKAEATQVINYLSAEAAAYQKAYTVGNSADISALEHDITDPTLTSELNKETNFVNTGNFDAAKAIYSAISNSTSPLVTNLENAAYQSSVPLNNAVGNVWVWGGKNQC